MSNRIKILDPITANQIAAGEVVERPASVVKELVENAVDAGSGQIEIEIAGAGVELIRVTDNGCGMEREDAILSLQRHATSKISSSIDLGAISTLGFRGEALPSIASVSNLEVITREPTSLGGTRLHISGGEITQIQDTGCPVGTTFSVRELFFNTPARRKFLKSDATEFGQISDVVNRMAMAYPGISFKFINQGRTLLHTSGNGNLLEAVSQVYGRELAREMIAVKYFDGDVSIEGLLGRPQHSRSTRAQQTFFINGRYIRSKALTQAVAEGYHTLVPSNRYPLVVLNLQLQANLVDVNVHPTKLEVRFAREAALVNFVASAIKEALIGSTLIPGLEQLPKPVAPIAEPVPIAKVIVPSAQRYPVRRESEAANVMEKLVELFAENSEKVPVTSEFEIQQPVSPVMSAPESFVTPSEIESTLPVEAYSEDSLEEQKLPERAASPEPQFEQTVWVESGEEAEKVLSRLPELQPLGQVDLTYIIAKGPDGLYVIDQHAAHERLNYEEIWAQAARGKIQTQMLLHPITLEFTNQEFAILLEQIAQLSDLGLVLEHFGGNTFLLRGHPLGIDNPQSLVRDLLELFTDGEKKLDPRKLREKFIYMLSCRSSVKANMRLNTTEMEHLIWRLGQAENPFSCPHGRPTIIAISSNELAKRFQRV